MDKDYKLVKSDKTSFEIKEENLTKIEIPQVHHKPMRAIEETPSGYDDPRWTEKSRLIKARDNYTCQICHTFDPSSGDFIFVKQGEYETIHHYDCYANSYNIQVMNMMLVITFDFHYGYHLAMPRLNVHHRIYYRHRNLWEYSDGCLVTLCERCHHYYHSLDGYNVPIVGKNAEGQDIVIGKCQTKPYNPVLDHTDLRTFSPLALVKENLWGEGLHGEELQEFQKAKDEGKHWYDYCKVLDDSVVSIRYFASYDTKVNKHSPEETKSIAEFIIDDFLENILGFSKE